MVSHWKNPWFHLRNAAGLLVFPPYLSKDRASSRGKATMMLKLMTNEMGILMDEQLPSLGLQAACFNNDDNQDPQGRYAFWWVFRYIKPTIWGSWNNDNDIVDNDIVVLFFCLSDVF